MDVARTIRKHGLVLLLVLLSCALDLAIPQSAFAVENSVPEGVDGTNWMSKLPDDASLFDLSIPGTHDSGTCWTWDNTMFSVCQQTTIGEHSYKYYHFLPWEDPDTISYNGMLNDGIRHLDLRVQYDGDDNYLCHGYALNKCKLIVEDSFWTGTDYENLTLDKVMDWVEGFLKDHPTETVILEVSNEINSDEDCASIFSNFGYIASDPNTILWTGDHAPTLGETRGKIVLFMNMKGTSDYPQSIYLYGRGYWALAVSWVRGDSKNKRADHAFSFNDLDVWSQNQWDGLDPDEKKAYVYNSLLGTTTCGGG